MVDCQVANGHSVDIEQIIHVLIKKKFPHFLKREGNFLCVSDTLHLGNKERAQNVEQDY